MVHKWVTAISMRKIIHLTGRDADSVTALGQRVKRARLRRNLTQEHMAKRAGVTRKTYQALEAGTPSASLALLTKVVAIFGCFDEVAGLLRLDPVGDALADRDGRTTASKTTGVADF